MTVKSINKTVFDKYKDDGSGYGTHLPALKFAFSNFNIKRVVEFGLGMFSTNFFLDMGAQLISIEMQDEEWLHKCVTEKQAAFMGDWMPIYNGTEIPTEFFKSHQNFDLAFIDGHVDSRPECVNEMFKLNVPVIIAHDFECPVYGWNRINVPSGYNRILFDTFLNGSIVTTAIFYKPEFSVFN